MNQRPNSTKVELVVRYSVYYHYINHVIPMKPLLLVIYLRKMMQCVIMCGLFAVCRSDQAVCVGGQGIQKI